MVVKGLKPNKVNKSIIKSAPHGSEEGLTKALWSEYMQLCKSDIHI